MPFSDMRGAARLTERIDEILALVRSWPGSRFDNNGSPVTRQITPGDLPKFEELDAKIGALMNALGFSFPPSIFSGTLHTHLHGYTKLRLLRSTEADRPDEWERRMIAVKHSAQEIVDVQQP